MRYRIVAVGRVKDEGVRSACNEYLKRLRHYAKVEETEVKDEARILGCIPDGSRLVALSRMGEAWTSRTLAERTAFHTGQSVEQIERDADRDRWFTAEQAKDYGFVDHVIRSALEVPSVGPVS